MREREIPEGALAEPVPYCLLDYDDETMPDAALRVWIFDTIHASDEVAFEAKTLAYCQSAFEWIKNGSPNNNGVVVPFPSRKPDLKLVPMPDEPA